jgi:hypothetical protein
LSLKYFAYFGGEVICNYMIHGFHQRQHVSDPDDAMEFFDSFFSMQLRKRSAHAVRTFEINKYNVMQLFTTHAQLLEIQKNTRDTESRKSASEIALQAFISAVDFNVGAPLAHGGVHPAIELDSDSVLQMKSGQPLAALHAENNTSVFAGREKRRVTQSESE